MRYRSNHQPIEPPVTEPPAIESQDRQSGSQKRPILIGIGALALLAITVIGVIWTLTTTDDASDLAKCDTWLRAQFVHHAETTASVQETPTQLSAPSKISALLTVPATPGTR